MKRDSRKCLLLLASSVALAGVCRPATAPGNTGAAAATLVRGFACIHRYEGSWTDPGAPYYGGLQMDWDFMSTYGREYLRAWGTADHWPPMVQVAVAISAYLSGRGFYPWPTSARLCGLIP